MAGTKEGGKAAARTNKAKYGENFYALIGSKGGKTGRTGGFFAKVVCAKDGCEFSLVEHPHYIRQCAGAKGGHISRRVKQALV